MKNIMKKGFTLAEILIVLTIIGVMAVMTIPSLIQNSNSQQKIAMFKKAFTSAVNAYDTEFALKNKPDNSTMTSVYSVFDALVNQLNVKYYQHIETGEKYYTKPRTVYLYWIVTEDGIGYRMSNANDECNKKIDINAQKNATNARKQSCLFIEVMPNVLKKGVIGTTGTNYDKAMCKDNTDLNKLNCNMMRFYVAKDGITSGNPDCVFAGRVMSDNTVYDSSKCQ